MTEVSQKQRNIKSDHILVSKTDLEGVITYCNVNFMIYSGHNLEDLVGTKHISIKHPDMPNSIYRHLWKELRSINEVNCVLKNTNKAGESYWTYMNATPSFDSDSKHIGYLFVQRNVSDAAIAYFDGLYKEMCVAESQHSSDDVAMDASYQLLDNVAASQGGHNEFVFSYYA